MKNVWEGVPTGVEELCIRTNEDDMVRRGDPWGSGTGATRAVDPFSTLRSVLEWAAFLFAVSSDHEDLLLELHFRLLETTSEVRPKILRATRVQLRAYGANESAEVDR